ncbi:hypothetical protein PSYRMG_25310 [Pseudomonas syringae UMAF0158]|nr:hypothetical protein PSYRMG_25310 [Pseudomonas syringae UMAF0158]
MSMFKREEDLLVAIHEGQHEIGDRTQMRLVSCLPKGSCPVQTLVGDGTREYHSPQKDDHGYPQ